MVTASDNTSQNADIVTGLPVTAKTNIVIPKEKFYQVAGANATIKRLFVDEVGKVTLKAVVAPRTMNITADTYDELNLIEIQLKDQQISQKVLETIDGIIPRPIIFHIASRNGGSKYAVAYKEPKAQDASKSKVVCYYQTTWNSEPLRIAGNSVKSIYVNFIQQIDPSFDPSVPIAEAVSQTRDSIKLKAKIEQLNNQIASELSIAKRQELARERHALEIRLED